MCCGLMFLPPPTFIGRWVMLLIGCLTAALHSGRSRLFSGFKRRTTDVYSPTALLPKILDLLRKSLRLVELFTFLRSAHIELILGKHSCIDLGFSFGLQELCGHIRPIEPAV